MADFVITYLQKFVNYEHGILPSDPSAFQLDRTKKLLSLLKDPQRAYPVIHVVGTKGKGSTAVFIASILRQSGLKVGLYTSPHLYDVKERIRILAPRAASQKSQELFEGKVSSQKLSRIFRRMDPSVQAISREKQLGRLTFFEILTVAAFSFFAQEKIDVAVVEAGLGGRLDATNTSLSDICVVTPISLDHIAQLGTTIERIAQEKSAVIKPGTRAVFSALQPPQAAKVIRRIAQRYHIPCVEFGRDIRVKALRQNSSGISFSVQISQERPQKLRSVLLGAYQAANAGLAVAVAKYFLGDKRTGIRQAISCGVQEARWPVRCEIIRRSPWIIADGAHNEDSIRKILATVKNVFPRRSLFVIFGSSKDKNIGPMLDLLTSQAAEVCLTRSQHPRSFDFAGADITCFKRGKKNISFVAADCKQALEHVLKKAKRQDIILATGSIFVASEIKKICEHIT